MTKISIRFNLTINPNIFQLTQRCQHAIFILSVGILCFLSRSKQQLKIGHIPNEEHISFKTILLPKSFVKSKFHKPHPRKHRYPKLSDFGRLEDTHVLDDKESRKIKLGSDVDDDNDGNSDDDSDDAYFRFDDAYFQFDDDKVHEREVNSKNNHCRYNDWHRYLFPTCNSIHETRIVGDDETNSYLSRGFYRQVFRIHDAASASPYVLKTLVEDLNYDIFTWESIHMDALVMERLTASPRIVDIYGYCAFSLSTEHLGFEFEDQMQWEYGYIEMDQLTDEVHNDIEDEDKLIYALEMAEAIADLHGFKEGIITHNDLQPSQFLLTKDFHLKLNDFNRAEIMLFDENDGEYCRYKNGEGDGNLRAPEEYKDDPLNEKIDVWGFGTIVYTLLTGLWVYFDIEGNYEEVASQVKSGEKPYIDDRYSKRGSFIEKALVHVLDRCFKYQADDRADIFELIRFLGETVHEYKNKNST